MPAKKPALPYFPALDGLRGIAILLVVIYHNFGFIDYFFFGWLGVDLFFVLSGFLITDILLNSLGSENFLRNFYMRRVLRIFPLYYLALIIFLVILPAVKFPLDLSYYTENQVWIWTYLQNWLYIFKNPGHSTTLNHLWSLAVEEQFYLFWPLIILLLKKPKALLVFISLLLLAVLGLRLWVWSNQITNLAYFNLYTFSRIDGICIGCMVALIQRINAGFFQKYITHIVLAFAAINFCFFFINRSYQFSFPYLALVGYTTFAMMFGLLVNEVVTGKSKLVDILLNNGLLKFFGKISYGLYIFHWPVFLMISPWLTNYIPSYTSDDSTKFITATGATLVAILVSWLSYRYYESHFLKLKTRFS